MNLSVIQHQITERASAFLNRATHWPSMKRSCVPRLRKALARSVIWCWMSLRFMVCSLVVGRGQGRSEEHTSELQSHLNLVCRLLLEKKKHTDKKPREEE